MTLSHGMQSTSAIESMLHTQRLIRTISLVMPDVSWVVALPRCNKPLCQVTDLCGSCVQLSYDGKPCSRCRLPLGRHCQAICCSQ